ncbi:hypothetical protein DF186_16850, partial [Enterococcus hirae]
RLSNLHDIFHISQLRKYTPDTNHILKPKSVQLKKNLTLLITPIRIDDTNIKKLHKKKISLIKLT